MSYRATQVPLQPPPGEPLTQVIARVLARRIVHGELTPGTPVRQDAVAREFSASHVPVREAFRKLEAQGLLISLPRRGVRVAPMDRAAVHEVTEMRATLEVLALRHAFPNWQNEDLKIAETAIAAGAASDEISVWEQANSQFHHALLRPCAMGRLLAAIDDLREASARFLFAAWRDLAWQPRSQDEHAAIIAAARAGDIERCARLLRAHILDAGRALHDSLPE